MKFKVGDKVRFLNESGGGIISKIVSHGLVNVAIEDGFEIPTMVSNLIKVEEESAPSMASSQPQPSAASAAEDAAQARIHSLLARSGQKVQPYGLYLAFHPVNQRWLLTGNMDIFLLNHTPYDVMFSLLLEATDGTYRSRDFDIIPRGSQYYLATVKPDQLGKWSKGTVQFLFRRKKLSKVLMPASVNFKISESRFLAESNYMENALMTERNFLVSLMPLPRGAEPEEEREGRDMEVPVIKARPELPEEVIKQYRTRDYEAVVDLHAESLSENPASLKAHEILTLQKATFRACLESAIRNDYQRVTFIHGIGEGKLKQEIIHMLEDYRHIRVQDAPMNEFGHGALELILR